MNYIRWDNHVVACGGLPFSGTGCPIPDVDNLCLLCIDLCLGCCFYFQPLPYGVFFVHGLCFSNNGLNKLPWISYLHAILRIISRGVSGLATDSPCGVWGRGWTTCLLDDSSVHFKMSWYASLQWDFIYFILFPASVNGFMHETNDFFKIYNNLFIHQLLCRLIYRRHSLYSFLLWMLLHIHD